MGFLSSSSSFTRYRVVEPVSNALLSEVHDLLVSHGIKDIDDTADERSHGWVNIDDMLDNGFNVSPPEKGSYLAFSMRMDTRRIAPAVYKKHIKLAFRDALRKAEGEGRKFLSKDQRKEIGERVKLSLLARCLPVPAVFDAVWNHEANRVYLASQSPKVRELFMDLFQRTFRLSLEPLTPYFAAAEILGPDKANKLDATEESDFTP